MAKSRKSAKIDLGPALAARDSCNHPPDRRVTIGCGIYCEDCEWLVGYITQEEFNRQIDEFMQQGVTGI